MSFVFNFDCILKIKMERIIILRIKSTILRQKFCDISFALVF